MSNILGFRTDKNCPLVITKYSCLVLKTMSKLVEYLLAVYLQHGIFMGFLLESWEIYTKWELNSYSDIHYLWNYFINV